MKASLKNFVGRLHVLWHRQDQPRSSSSIHTSSTSNEKGQKGSSSRGRQFLLPEEEENDVHSHRVSPTSSRSGRDTPPGSGIKGQFATCKDNELTDDDENPSSHFLGGHAAKNSVRSIHQRQKECHFRKHDTFELTQKGATAYANSSYRPHVPLEDQSSSFLSSEYNDDEEDNCGNDPRALMGTKASRQDAAVLLSHRSHPDRK